MPRYLRSQTKKCLNERTIQMTKDDISELSEMGQCEQRCAFCLSRCPDCGSVNIGVKYRRYYQIDEDEKIMTYEYSDAHIYCYNCNPEIEDDDPFGIYAEEEAESEDEKAMLEGISSPELAEQLDRHFYDHEPYELPPHILENIEEEPIDYFVNTYTFKNNIRNRIRLHTEDPVCVDYDGFNSFNDDIAYDLADLISSTYVDLSFDEEAEKTSKHVVINTTHLFSRVV